MPQQTATACGSWLFALRGLSRRPGRAVGVAALGGTSQVEVALVVWRCDVEEGVHEGVLPAVPARPRVVLVYLPGGEQPAFIRVDGSWPPTYAAVSRGELYMVTPRVPPISARARLTVAMVAATALANPPFA